MAVSFFGIFMSVNKLYMHSLISTVRFTHVNKNKISP